MKLTLIIRMAIGITCILISFNNHFSDVASMFFVRYECRLLLWLVNLNLSRESDQMTVKQSYSLLLIFYTNNSDLIILLELKKK